MLQEVNLVFKLWICILQPPSVQNPPSHLESWTTARAVIVDAVEERGALDEGLIQ